MSELSDLYQEVILDHNKQPRNFHDMKDADHHAEGFNPLCGDRCTVYLKMDGDKIGDVSFLGSGCAISKASSSIMTTVVKGKKKEDVMKLFDVFHAMVTGAERASDSFRASGLPGGSGGARSDPPLEAKLQVFSGVSEFPARVKCASLAWHTLKAAMENKGETVSTETGGDSGSGA
jgi:nitrogen fixation protein NifU and related proteins